MRWRKGDAVYLKLHLQSKKKKNRYLCVCVVAPSQAYRLLLLLSCQSCDHISGDEGSTTISFIVFKQCVCVWREEIQRHQMNVFVCVGTERASKKGISFNRIIKSHSFITLVLTVRVRT